MTAATRVSMLAGLLGLSLAAVVLARLQWQHPGPLVRVLASLGWPLLAACLVRALTLAQYTVSWRALLPAEQPIRFGLLLRLRWIGDAINGLLPAMQVGGDLARARLMVRMAGVAPAVAGAALILDITVGALSQVVFTGMGLAALASSPGTQRSLRPLLAGGLILLAGAAILLLALRFGRRPLRWLVRRLQRRALASPQASGPGRDAGDLPEVADLETAVQDLLARRGALLRSFAWHLTGWLCQAAETWLILLLLGHPISAGAALALDSLAGAARAAVFFVPGGLGVQEGALGFLAVALGVPPETALALVLVKRLREVVLGLPGLMLWVFHERDLLDRLARRLRRKQPT